MISKQTSVALIAIGVVLASCGAAIAAGTWARAIGGSSWGIFNAVARTTSGEIVAAGNLDDDDGWVVKMTESGSIVWQKSFGGAGIENFVAAVATVDGGCALAGYSGPYGAIDAWVMRLDSSGSVIWQRSYGGTGGDSFSAIVATADGGFIVAGSTRSFGAGSNDDGWLLKLTSGGDVQWQQMVGGTGTQFIHDVVQAGDGGYMAVGTRMLPSGTTGWDGWILKLDASGNMLAERTMGASGSDAFDAVVGLDDGTFLLGGNTTSYGVGGNDGWLVRLDGSAVPIWMHTLGDGDQQAFRDVAPAGSGAYAVTGEWGADSFIGKVDLDGAWEWGRRYGRSTATDLAIGAIQTPDGGVVLAGYAQYSDGKGDGWALKVDATGGVASACGIAQPLSTTQTSPPVTYDNPTSTATVTSAVVTSPSNTATTTSRSDTFFCSSGPTITSVKSKSAKPGSPATIRGSGFSTTAKENTVYFGSKKAKIKSAKNTQLKVTIPAGLSRGSLGVRVVVNRVSSNTVGFTIK